MWKKITVILLALALLPASAFAATTNNPAIKVEYNGKAIVFPDQKPVIVNSRTLVPIRPIAEGLGFQVDWNNTTRTVTITNAKNKVTLVVSQKIAKRNNDTITLDVPAQIINKRTMVPVRFIAEALDNKVDWVQATQTVKITDKQQAQTPTTEPTKPTDPKQSTTEQQGKTANLIDRDSIVAKTAPLANVDFFKIAGKVDPAAKLTVTMDDEEYEVTVKDDGSFLFEHAGSYEDDLPGYTLKAVKGEGTDTLEGEFKEVK